MRSAIGVTRCRRETLLSRWHLRRTAQVTDQARPAPQSAVHAFCHVLPNLWHQMSVMLSAASCLQWFCRLTGTTEVALLAETPSKRRRRQCAVLSGPYLRERNPHNDPDARGIFWGMTHASLRAQLGYAVLEE